MAIVNKKRKQIFFVTFDVPSGDAFRVWERLFKASFRTAELKCSDCGGAEAILSHEPVSAKLIHRIWNERPLDYEWNRLSDPQIDVYNMR